MDAIELTTSRTEKSAAPQPAAPHRCRRSRRWSQWVLGVFAIGYAILMLHLGGATTQRLYGPSPFHRQQAEALIEGRLNIGNSIYGIAQNTAWSNGKSQQVWGLGVGMWLVPFELIYRLFGQKEFPDRIAMGVAFALLAAYSGSTGLRLVRQCRTCALGIGLVCLTLFNPTLFYLNGGRHLIYEDTVLYACLLSFGMLIAVVRVAAFNSTTDYFICATLAALSGLVRPTHLLYGLVGLGFCSLLLYLRRKGIRQLLMGGAIFLAGLCVLAGTNQARFGSPFEFGHRLTATGGAMVYFTRFDNPFRGASVVEAGKELFGALFFPTGHIQLTSAEDVAAGQMFESSSRPDVVRYQSSIPRWRDMYMPTFDRSVAILVLLGMGGGVWWFKRRTAGAARKAVRRPGTALVGGLLDWSLAGVVGLGCFYLYFSVLCARYLLDFAPAFTAALLLVWIGISTRFPKMSLVLLAIWLGSELLPARGGVPSHYLLKRKELPPAARLEGRKQLGDYRGGYGIDGHPAETRIPFNGEGWSPDDGSAAPVVVVMIDRPEFVELEVEPRLPMGAARPTPDHYRARIGNAELPLERLVEKDGAVVVRFIVPGRIRERQADELLYLCFIEKCDEDDRTSQRVLRSVRWR